MATYGTALGYGPAGGGKTRAIESLLKHDITPLILATELGETHGLLSLASSEIDFVVLESHAQTIDVIRAMKRKPGKVEYEQKEFTAVVLDSITQWGEYPLARYKELKGWEDLHDPPMKGRGKDSRGAYGFLAEKGRQLYKELFELHCHLFVIAREGLFGGDGDIDAFAAPELPGQKLPREVPGWPDATVRLRRINGQFRMVTQSEGNTPARIRLPQHLDKLPSRCLPDVGALLKYLTGDAAMSEFLIPQAKPK